MAASDITKATLSDCVELATKLRAEDRRELEASNGDVDKAIMDSLRGSNEAWAVRFDGELVCCFGVAEQPGSIMGPRRGQVWLLTTGVVETKARRFWCGCLVVISDLFERWDELSNAIDVRHTKAIRWAERLGFRLGPPVPFGVEGLPFRWFTVRRKDFSWSRRS
jgi:hypothetical protein